MPAANPVEDQSYYHGFLPREDVECLLKDPGDFLVRLTEPKPGDPTQYVISVVSIVERQKKKEGLSNYLMKHIVLDYVNGKYTFDQRQFFNEIPELVKTYMDEKIVFSVGSGPKREQLKKPINRPDWELNHDWIELGQELGAGQFGVVRKANLNLPPPRRSLVVAVKVAKITDNPEIKTKIREIMQEARTMRNFHHINVVSMYGVAVEVEPLMIVIEFVPHGDLKNYLIKNNLSIETKMAIMMQAASGIAYLHSRNCIHRDIAARNCLVGGEPIDNIVIKISDFGLSREGTTYRIQHDRPLPVRWLAPEVLNTHIFDQKSDVWSFAMTVMEIFGNGAEPYPDMTKDQAKEDIKQYKGPNAVPDMPEKVYAVLKKSVWVPVKCRGTMEEVITALNGPKTTKQPSAQKGANNTLKKSGMSTAKAGTAKSGAKSKEKSPLKRSKR